MRGCLVPLSPYPFAPWPCLHAAPGPHCHPDPSCVLPICPQVWGLGGALPSPIPLCPRAPAPLCAQGYGRCPWKQGVSRVRGQWQRRGHEMEKGRHGGDTDAPVLSPRHPQEHPPRKVRPGTAGSVAPAACPPVVSSSPSGTSGPAARDPPVPGLGLPPWARLSVSLCVRLPLCCLHLCGPPHSFKEPAEGGGPTLGINLPGARSRRAGPWQRPPPVLALLGSVSPVSPTPPTPCVASPH